MHVHEFDNGIRILEKCIIPKQRERYAICNLHEPEEEEVFVRCIGAVPEGGCFLNIGGAVGYYALLAKKLKPSLNIQVVEPLVKHRRLFRKNIILNGFSGEDFGVHAEGISHHEGRERFIQMGFGSGIRRGEDSSIGFLRNAVRKLKGGTFSMQTIPTISLDQLMERIQVVVDLCQIDVQGEELQVLQGGEVSLTEGRIRGILLGTHSVGLHQQCSDLLREKGYAINIDCFETSHQPDGILLATKGLAVEAGEAEGE